MAERIHNFNAGPSTLPLPVLETVQRDLLDYDGTGMSVMEISHRSKPYEAINANAEARARELLGLDDRFSVVFVGGGASTQFALVPMNFLGDGATGAYVDTGSWSSKAIKEAHRFGEAAVIASSKDDAYSFIPAFGPSDVPDGAAYVHLTSNNTIYGTQYQSFPDVGDVPLVCDMSSDICSRRHDFSRFSLIYAGAQKNLGPAGVTMVVIRDDFLARAKGDLPTMFRYQTHVDAHSLYNTPPAFAVYVTSLVMDWIVAEGGLDAIEKRNRAKKNAIYGVVDEHADFYRGTVRADSRSWMNLTFRLPSEDLEKTFIAEAASRGMGGLKGHRSVGGVRVSLYNAMTEIGVETLVQFMRDFRSQH